MEWKALAWNSSHTSLSEDKTAFKSYMWGMWSNSPSFEKTRNATDIEEPTKGIILGPDMSYHIYDISGESNSAIPAEDLKDSLKKQLEFHFLWENLSKDLYLLSQMDDDWFTPKWIIANMEEIRKLTKNADLFLDVLRSPLMVQVDKKVEMVRTSHECFIVILRGVAETTTKREDESFI